MAGHQWPSWALLSQKSVCTLKGIHHQREVLRWLLRQRDYVSHVSGHWVTASEAKGEWLNTTMMSGNIESEPASPVMCALIPGRSALLRASQWTIILLNVPCEVRENSASFLLLPSQQLFCLWRFHLFKRKIHKIPLLVLVQVSSFFYQKIQAFLCPWNLASFEKHFFTHLPVLTSSPLSPAIVSSKKANVTSHHPWVGAGCACSS